MKRKYLSAEERFVKNIKVNANSGCWEWTGGKNAGGYGTMSVNGKPTPVHRWAYEQVNGKIPFKLLACHKCDNPCCANPDHIFIGTYKDNMVDLSKKYKMGKTIKIVCKKCLSAEIVQIGTRPTERRRNETHRFNLRTLGPQLQKSNLRKFQKLCRKSQRTKTARKTSKTSPNKKSAHFSHA